MSIEEIATACQYLVEVMNRRRTEKKALRSATVGV
jgi:hypothetical protein